mgnify:CR=1 FL=1
MDKEFIQVGFVGLRKPNGEVYQTLPIFCPATPELKANEKAMLEKVNQIRAEMAIKYIAAKKQEEKQKASKN